MGRLRIVQHEAFPRVDADGSGETAWRNHHAHAGWPSLSRVGRRSRHTLDLGRDVVGVLGGSMQALFCDDPTLRGRTFFPSRGKAGGICDEIVARPAGHDGLAAFCEAHHPHVGETGANRLPSGRRQPVPHSRRGQLCYPFGAPPS